MIEIKNVSFYYESNDREAGLRNINLTIKSGETVLLCGESGCGKTTLTRLINGLIPNYYEGRLEGSIIVKGKDIPKAPLYETASVVGSVFQNPRSQFFNIDTTSELAFGCENMGMEKEEILRRIEKTARELNMENLMDRSIFALSGGEKQKIACGSVSALDPEIIVLDEPSSNLDAKATEDLYLLLKIWKSQGKTIIISEHRLHYLSSLINRVIYMNSGKIEKEFTSSEFLSLTEEERISLGLRPISIKNIGKTEKQPPSLISEEKIILEDFCFTYKNGCEGIKIKSCSFPKGSIIAVIGHNGAGKSTFARCLCGLEKKCKGTMQFNNLSLKAKDRLKNCYMVLQDVNHQLFTESVMDEVLLSMETEDEKAGEEILAGLNLSAFKDIHPMALSGGQKQRVAIASAVASQRDIIIFDEPTSGLDLRHMREVSENIIRLQNKGKTIFVITHDPELILNCCTYVTELKNGKIEEEYALDEKGISRMLDFFTSNDFS